MGGFRWRVRGWGKDRTVELRPHPRLREITYDLFERVCHELSIDADLMFRGGVSLLDIEKPALSSAQRVFDLIVENAGHYDLRAMAPDRVDALLGLVVADFFLRVLRPETQSLATGAS